MRRRTQGSIISFFVISAAAPLTAMAGGAPVAMLLGNGPGIPAAYILVSLLLLVFSVGYTAMARHHTSTGAFYSYVTRGLDRAPRLQRHADRPVRLVLAEFVIVLILDVLIVAKGGEGGGAPLTLEPFSWGALTSGSLAIALLFNAASFIGFEATTIYSEEAKDPRRRPSSACSSATRPAP